MAYSRSNTAPVVQTTDDSWKATAFLNFYIPRENGEDGKLGAIKLLLANEDHVKLAAWLLKDEANVAKFMSRVKLVVRSAEKAPGTGFALD